ncbi:MAG: hypothetical protein JNM93_04340 [Bacteriovoracaceae bacterium]|nr:hypothetical protein [Bacteriovoracaceae bacterium]
MTSLKLFIICLLSMPLFFGCMTEVMKTNRPVLDDISSGGGDGEDEEVVRPDKAVFIKSGFCACKNGVTAILGNCASFCATKGNTGNKTLLYLETTLGPEILLNSQLGNLDNWCKKVIEYTDDEGETQTVGTNPSCKAILRDSDGNEIILDSPTVSSNNKLTIDLIDGVVGFNKTYVLSIVETESGASSDSIQIRRITGLDSVSDLSPLKIDPANGYTCISRGYSVDEDSGTIFYESAFKLHYYFIDWDAPPIIPQGTINIFCHDIAAFGANDSSLYPRLELNPGIFSVWSMNDARFYDSKIDPTIGTVNGKLDIHDIIDALIKSDGGVGLSNDIFFKLEWPNFPQGAATGDSQNPGGTSNPPTLGYVMSPWINSTTNISYCPTSTHYYGTNLTLQALRDVVGIDTEGLYLGIKESESQTLSDGTVVVGPDDYVIIREGLLRSIWFYVQAGQAIAPTPLTEGSKTLHFYWPPNINAPYIKNSDQRLYTIRHPSQISSTSLNGGTSQVNITQIPHDKKFACGPKAD